MYYLHPIGFSTNTSNWSKCQNISIREIDHRFFQHQINWNLDSAGKAVCRKGLSSNIFFYATTTIR